MPSLEEFAQRCVQAWPQAIRNSRQKDACWRPDEYAYEQFLRFLDFQGGKDRTLLPSQPDKRGTFWKVVCYLPRVHALSGSGCTCAHNVRQQRRQREEVVHPTSYVHECTKFVDEQVEDSQPAPPVRRRFKLLIKKTFLVAHRVAKAEDAWEM